MRPEFETEVVNGFTYLVTADGRRLQVPSGGSPEGEEEGAGATGDAGGVGGDAESPASDDGDTAEAHADGASERDAGDTGEKASTAGLQKRLKSVIEQRNKYRALGTPEELQALKEKNAEYQRYEQQIEVEERERRDEEARKAGKPTVAEQNAALDRVLEQRFGAGAVDDFQAFRDTRKREIARHTRDALDHLKTRMGEHNLKTDGETLENWERHLGVEFKADQELAAKFRDPVTQKDALDEAFTRVRRGLVDPSLVAVGAEKLAKAKARRDSTLGAGGAGGGTQLEHFENLQPPKGLNADQRSSWWSKQMNSAADAMEW